MLLVKYQNLRGNRKVSLSSSDAILVSDFSVATSFVTVAVCGTVGCGTVRPGNEKYFKASEFIVFNRLAGRFGLIVWRHQSEINFFLILTEFLLSFQTPRGQFLSR